MHQERSDRPFYPGSRLRVGAGNLEATQAFLYAKSGFLDPWQCCGALIRDPHRNTVETVTPHLRNVCHMSD